MRVSLPVIQQQLAEQQRLTAVERFASLHDAGKLDHDAREYSDLVPLNLPRPGEQYAFRVNLDACTGCKACVTACHSLNGLDEGETWRFVGVLHGGTSQAPVVQTVTSACHHCLDPACMSGCPVEAYEKDPVTGIVRHLDDQCIGCQYCTLTCPYDVPQYNAKKGIVRKCDMCADRLAEGEAPACVQACPNGAISIQVVSRAAVIEDAQGDAFLPGAPSPGITVPTTTYASERASPRNLLPLDFYALRPAQRHAPLVAMLVLTQLAAGAFAVDRLLEGFGVDLGPARPLHALLALAIGLAGVNASLLHLGRPMYAFRAVIGLRTSWLSREILTFGLFAAVGVAYVASLSFVRESMTPWPGEVVVTWLAAASAVSGLGGVVCSVMVYAATRRPWWSAPRTALMFFGTAAVLGFGTAAFAGAWHGVPGVVVAATTGALVALVAKIGAETSVLLNLRERTRSDLKRTALLLAGALGQVTRWRLGLGAAAAAAFVATRATAQSADAGDTTVVVLGACALCLTLAGEILERTLFFRALSSSRMPGAAH
jgi:Fe-S-cluster-containing dehydrogenase component/DMSO reductase anchor subunit